MQIPSEEIKKAKKCEEIRKAKKGEESEERASLLRRDESSWKHNGGVAQFQLVNAYNCDKKQMSLQGPKMNTELVKQRNTEDLSRTCLKMNCLKSSNEANLGL